MKPGASTRPFASIDLFARGGLEVADRGDAVAVDADIGRAQAARRAVRDLRIDDDGAYAGCWLGRCALQAANTTQRPSFATSSLSRHSSESPLLVEIPCELQTDGPRPIHAAGEVRAVDKANRRDAGRESDRRLR